MWFKTHIYGNDLHLRFILQLFDQMGRFSDITVIRNIDFFGSELVQFILIPDHKFCNHQFENQFKVKVHEKPLETPFISWSIFIYLYFIYIYIFSLFALLLISTYMSKLGAWETCARRPIQPSKSSHTAMGKVFHNIFIHSIYDVFIHRNNFWNRYNLNK